jgi:hypothetical protein
MSDTPVRNILFKSGEIFRVTLSNLRRRQYSLSALKGSNATGVDFSGVYFLDCELEFSGIEIYQCSDEEFSAIRIQFSRQLDNPGGVLYALISDSRTYYIVAETIKIRTYGTKNL